MYRRPPAPPTIDVLSDDQVRARRLSRTRRIVFILVAGLAGWFSKDRLDWSSLQAKGASAWAAAVDSFHQAFPGSAPSRMIKGGPAPTNAVPKGGTVSPEGRSQRVPVIQSERRP